MSLTSDYILNKIRSTSEERDLAIKHIMNDVNLRYKVVSYIKSNKGSLHDAEIIFDDMIITFVKKIMNNRSIVVEEHIHGYLVGIAKLLWNNYRRKEKRHSHGNIDSAIHYQSSDPKILDLLINEESKGVISGVLNQIHYKCKSLLLYWAKDYSMIEIAELLSYSSEGAVRKKKSDCLKSLRQYLINNPESKQQLKNYLLK